MVDQSLFKTNYKVIGKSQYDIESIADVLIQENMTEAAAVVFAEELNERVRPGDTYYFFAVPIDHKLWRGMEELI